jgi:hypothetical protein
MLKALSISATCVRARFFFLSQVRQSTYVLWWVKSKTTTKICFVLLCKDKGEREVLQKNR